MEIVIIGAIFVGLAGVVAIGKIASRFMEKIDKAVSKTTDAYSLSNDEQSAKVAIEFAKHKEMNR
ncbi:MAG: hypothetical protein FWD49_02705 [Firmicutes bacterium]|nr:hypothetical protein [Bacillota bacterium]